jgi:DNA-binding transcriptional LysR family regulator
VAQRATARANLSIQLFIFEKLKHHPAMNWDDLHLFLQVAQANSMSAATGQLKLSVATISRRLEALERQMGIPLLKRTPRGLTLTEQGAALKQRAADCESEMAGIARFAASLRTAAAAPFIRMSATEPVISEIFAPEMARFTMLNPAWRIELRVENTLVSLALNDADIAIRLTRPTGDSLMAKRLKPLAMGLYGQRDYVASITATDGPDLGRAAFISYDDSYGPIPELRWITEGGFGPQVRVRTSSTRGMVNAVAAGAGLAILPKVFASRQPGLVEIRSSTCPPIAERNIWIVWHRDMTRRPGIRETIRWVEECFRRAVQPSLPSAGNTSSNQ